MPQYLPYQDSDSPHETLRKGRVKRDRLWPWYAATAVYLSLALMLLYVRRTEFGYACVSGSAGCGGLQLNDIGDIAAGIFAPLAFLWLFVATLLQRRELGLQREELADTRAVLNDQRIELERSAEESNRQTAIMHSNLEASKSREAYDYFGLKLYYISRSIREGIGISIVARK